MSNSTELQLGFSKCYRDAAYDAAARERKARKVIAILQDHLGSLTSKTLLDIGCSTGYMTRLYATHFQDVVGTDVDEDAVQFAAGAHRESNLFWTVQDSQHLGFSNESFDVITCNHVYEHVPDARLLVDEIHRLLRPGGACFFSAGNRFSLVEPHYRLPLLSVIPKPMAHLYMRFSGRGSHYYEKHLSLWSLRRLVSRFQVTDYTLRVVLSPKQFHADDMIPPGSVRQKRILFVLQHAYWLCPTYLWVLRKISV